MENMAKRGRRPKRLPAEMQAMVDGGRLLYSIASKLVTAVYKAGGDASSIRRLDMPDFSPLIEQLAKDIVEECPPPIKRDVFTVTVDYTLSLVAMIAAGKYDWASSDIVSERFPVVGMGKGKVEARLRLINFGRKMSDRSALAELDQRGLRPATLPFLLAFGARYPEEQRRYPIVALGSLWADPNGNHKATCLKESAGERELCLADGAGDWGDDCRFLIVCD